VPYAVQLTPAARQDLVDLVTYIRRDSPQAAESVAERLLAALESLGEFPERTPFAPESERWKLEVRSLVVFRYRVLYHIQPAKQRVTVLRILHGSRIAPPEPPLD
jgi:toxin ParE1/3/4